jgi:hypothetical protein
LHDAFDFFDEGAGYYLLIEIFHSAPAGVSEDQQLEFVEAEVEFLRLLFLSGDNFL